MPIAILSMLALDSEAISPPVAVSHFLLQFAVAAHAASLRLQRARCLQLVVELVDLSGLD